MVGFDEFMKVQAEHADVFVIIRIDLKPVSFSFGLRFGITPLLIPFFKKNTLT